MQLRSLSKDFLSRRYPALIWTILIFILLALPGNLLPRENHFFIPNFDKLVHITLFGSFVFLWSSYYSLKNKEKANPVYRYLLILVIGCLYGIAMEYVQKYFIPNRDFDVMDILADVIGAVLGFIFLLLTIPWIRTA